MAAERYFADSMTVTVATADDATSVPVGAIRNVEIIVEAEHIKFYDPSSILRQDVKKRQLVVPVRFQIGAFDETFADEWMAGSTTATADGTVEDTNDVMLFDITGTVTGSGGTTQSAAVEDVFFPSLQLIAADEGTWVAHDVEGEGKTVVLSQS